MLSDDSKYEPGGYRHVLKLVIPMVLSNAAFTIMQFTDRLLLARYSSEAIQAALPAGVISFTLTSFFAAVAGYASTFVSQHYGAKDEIGAAKSFMAGILLSVLSGPIVLLMLPLCSWLLSIAGHSKELLAAEKTYAFWMILSGTPMAMHWVMSGYLTGRNHVVSNTVATVIGSLTNIGLDILLIFGHCGLPRMGIEGAALATFISQLLTLLYLAVAIYTDKETRSLPWRAIIKPDWSLARRIIHFGLPAGVQLFFDVGSFSVFTLLVARYDPLSLATSNIVFTINNLAISPAMGFGNAAAILVGQFQGAKNSLLARKSCWRCQHLAWGYMVLIGAIFMIFPNALLEIFKSPDSEYTVEQMVSLGKKLLVLLVAWGMFDTMSAVLGGGLRGAGDTHFALKAIVGSSWLFWLPMEILIICVLKLEIIHAWYGMLVFIILLSFILLWRWHGDKWEKIQVLKHTS